MQGRAVFHVLVVRAGGERLGLPLVDVVEVLPALAGAALPDAPPMVCGVVNLRGEPLPLVSLRERIGLPTVEPHPDHHVVVCLVAGRRVGLWVDVAEVVTEVEPDGVVPAEGVVASRHLDGVAVLPDGLLLVYDVRSFLDADDVLRLDSALASVTETAGLFAGAGSRARRTRLPTTWCATSPPGPG